MKEMHRLIVTSDTYKLASEVDPAVMPANTKADPANTYLWHFRLQRLEAEPIWDSILAAAGDLDLTVGGPSFDRAGGRPAAAAAAARPAQRRRTEPPRRLHDPRLLHQPRRRCRTSSRRSTWTTAAPLPAADPDRHRAAGPVPDEQRGDRTARPAKFAERLQKESGGDLEGRGRPRLPARLRPAAVRRGDGRALTYLEDDPARLKGLAWLLFNLDEFIYVR